MEFEKFISYSAFLFLYLWIVYITFKAKYGFNKRYEKDEMIKINNDKNGSKDSIDTLRKKVKLLSFDIMLCSFLLFLLAILYIYFLFHTSIVSMAIMIILVLISIVIERYHSRNKESFLLDSNPIYFLIYSFINYVILWICSGVLFCFIESILKL